MSETTAERLTQANIDKLRAYWSDELIPKHGQIEEYGLRLIAHVEQAEAQLGEAQQQLRYWWEAQHSCPCGARAKALDTHPHVLACPTERASLEPHG